MEGISVGDIKNILKTGQPANIKYVRIKDEFRYAITGGPVEHKQLVNEGENPISAGFFTAFGEDFVMSNAQSTSLALGPHEDDGALLREIFKNEENQSPMVG